MLPSVSIGIAAFNAAPYIADAINSVCVQTYGGPLEVIVINDGSTDGTLGIVKDLQRKPYRRGFRILTSGFLRNRGIAAAKNAALRWGVGDVRGILDADDFYAPSFVERCVDALSDTVGMVYTDNAVCYGDGTPKRVDPAGEPFLDAVLRCQVRGDCWLARWDVLERTRLHDERMELEVDYDLFYQLATVTECRRIAEPLQTVREHDSRTTRDRIKAAFWHAAGLAKHGHGREWAERRATAHPEWREAIEAGWARGLELRDAEAA